MEHKLSIIMPCYNCSSTLEEAVDSIFRQNLKTPFEVVMVDDGSNDNTKELIKKLADKYKEIKYFFHEENKGGGATRNTAVANSNGDIIFCLDSDDILAENTLPKMIDYLDQKNCDGVLFNEAKYFTKNINVINAIDKNKNKDEIITFNDLFEKNVGTLTTINFLYKKSAFYEAGGYPSEHGFDTQGYGFRFLAKNLKVYVCPNSFYYHRQAYKKKSYFERIYQKGEMSKNFYLILEETIYLFSKNVRKNILSYDIFKNSKLGKNNLKSFMDEMYQQNKNNFFIENKEEYMDKDGLQKFYNKFKNSTHPEDIFCIALYLCKSGDYSTALKYFNKLPMSPIISYNKLKTKLLTKNNYKPTEIDTIVSKNFKFKKQKIYLNPNLFLKFLILIKSRLTKIKI